MTLEDFAPAHAPTFNPIERGGGQDDRTGALSFGVPLVDAQLPDGGLKRGALHEVVPGTNSAEDAAAALLFAAGIAARSEADVFWAISRPDLFAPPLSEAGLPPDRLTVVETGDPGTVISVLARELRRDRFDMVVGEVGRLSRDASRRLQRLARSSGTTVVAVPACLDRRDARWLGRETAAATRWRVHDTGTGHHGRALWAVEMIRYRARKIVSFDLLACDRVGRLALPSGRDARREAHA